MERILIKQLYAWKDSPRRKPLMVKGMRQVGKTWLIKEFGRLAYEDTAYFNFEGNIALAERFKPDLDPRRLIQELGILNGQLIKPGKTLIVFDEIQFCSEAITALKYFSENAPEYHLICAGSLLGIILAKPASYPVGKIDVLNLYPLSFKEYLMTEKEDLLIQYLEQDQQKTEPLPQIFANKLEMYLKNYLVVGGMPDVVKNWLETRDIQVVETTQQNILNLFELDFAKHAPVTDIPKLSLIWHSIPNQLAKENGKFVYGQLREGAAARTYENALTWLRNAGMVYQVQRVEKPANPLKAYMNPGYFKLYMADVGLLRKMSGLNAKAIFETDFNYQEFKGVMAENFCLQELILLNGEPPAYWTSNNQAEVDFIVQMNDLIIPIEVKAATNTRARSLAVYREKYKPVISVKSSLRNLSFSDGLLNCPLYLLWRLAFMLSQITGHDTA